MDIQQFPIDIQYKIKHHYNVLCIQPFFSLWKYKTPTPCIWNNQIRKWRSEFEKTNEKKTIDFFLWYIMKQNIYDYAFPLPGIECELTLNMGFYYMFEYDEKQKIINKYKYYMED
jgi:hypothetical protein